MVFIISKPIKPRNRLVIPIVPCCSKETGSLIFAMISSIVSSLASLLSVMGFIILSIEVISHKGFSDNNFNLDVIAAAVFLFSSVSLAISLILVRGLLQKKPSHIKVYLIYGVILITILLATTVAVFVIVKCDPEEYKEFKDELVMVKSAMLSILFFYFLILVMIWKTYKGLSNAKQFDPKALLES